jgi:hypothetical protein
MEEIFDGVYVAQFVLRGKRARILTVAGGHIAYVHVSRTYFDSTNYENAISSASFGQRSSRYYYLAREPRSRSSSGRGKKCGRRR